jgi:hypothetical protein
MILVPTDLWVKGRARLYYLRPTRSTNYCLVQEYSGCESWSQEILATSVCVSSGSSG